MKTIYITNEINYVVQKTPEGKARYFEKFTKEDRLISQQFKTKESAIYHLCTNQIIWS